MSQKWRVVQGDGFKTFVNEGGRTISLSDASGRGIIEKNGFVFRDLDGDGALTPYKDWRLTAEERAADLAQRLTVEEIAGLMLYSAHQAVPGKGFFAAQYGGTYGGKRYEDAKVSPWAMTDQQKRFLKEDHVRHVLVTSFEDVEAAVRWNNAIQAYVEGLGRGIPVNLSTDPRHSADARSEFNAGAGGKYISKWPEHLGLAATFDPETSRRYARTAAEEYRALGIATALSPQIDLATDPRWMRFKGTFGEDWRLAADMAQACCDGFQTSSGEREIADGWGLDSVNAMAKHWPGGGSGEAGRDAHYAAGKYAVYPGGNFAAHLKPFVEGAFNLPGKTRKASAVMPYYTISFNQDTAYGENVGNGFSRYILTDLLRERYGYDGVVCTDWRITHDSGALFKYTSGQCWGMENSSVAERHYKALMAGVDQFGGNQDVRPVLDAYAAGVAEHGEKHMRARFETSARRLLLNMFRPGLFDNPYLSLEASRRTVGCRQYVQSGFDAQIRSIVCLKNRGGVLPVREGSKVFIPKNHTDPSQDWYGNAKPAKDEWLFDLETVAKFYAIAETPEDADFALVAMRSPISAGYSAEDADAGGNGYIPISLQYGPYTAATARRESIAGGDPREKTANRSYRGKAAIVYNRSDLDSLLEVRRRLGPGKPLVAALKPDRPMIVAEFEPQTDAILVDFGVDAGALMRILSGRDAPSGLLPMQIPRDMETVEAQCEDVGRDMEPHVDSEGNAYDFAFGMTFDATIRDHRVEKYAPALFSTEGTQ